MNFGLKIHSMLKRGRYRWHTHDEGLLVILQ
nr:MAG TPA: hypothetical protein [Caudoviricetes sp.]